MRITIDRSGGFANFRRHYEIDTATLPRAEAEEIERLATAAGNAPASFTPMPDAFTYAITIDGTPYVTSDPTGKWEELIRRL